MEHSTANKSSLVQKHQIWNVLANSYTSSKVTNIHPSPTQQQTHKCNNFHYLYSEKFSPLASRNNKPNHSIGKVYQGHCAIKLKIFIEKAHNNDQPWIRITIKLPIYILSHCTGLGWSNCTTGYIVYGYKTLTLHDFSVCPDRYFVREKYQYLFHYNSYTYR